MDESGASLDREIKGQGMFVSTFRHSLDPKRRLTIPSEWRAQVGEPRGLYVLPDVHHRCLCVLPAKAILPRLERMKQHSIADMKARQFARTLASQSDLVTWDTQGRIRVKDDLLDFAGLKDDVALVGAFDSFELWNPDRLKEQGGMDPSGLQEAARYVGF